MPKPPVPDVVSEFLSKPNPAVIATVRPDGQPVSVATWYLWDDGRVLVNMDNARKRVEYLRKDPRASITILSSRSTLRRCTLCSPVTNLRPAGSTLSHGPFCSRVRQNAGVMDPS